MVDYPGLSLCSQGVNAVLNLRSLLIEIRGELAATGELEAIRDGGGHRYNMIDR